MRTVLTSASRLTSASTYHALLAVIRILGDRMARLIPGAAPHAARRFYISWLRKCRVLEEIIRSQVGHADVSITDNYSFQDENTVRSAIEAAGLGFNLA